ncbi:MAG: hypothetical protein C0517_04035 [Erythrobacter sp.]|nr:hypothetical protein [Erythrobacter sp.]
MARSFGLGCKRQHKGGFALITASQDMAMRARGGHWRGAYKGPCKPALMGGVECDSLDKKPIVNRFN